MDSSPSLGLLGGFELAVGGSPQRLPLSSQRIIAFLALQARPVQRQFVAGTLWPESSDVRANANLRTALWRLGDAHGVLAEGTAQHLALADTVEVDLHDVVARAQRLIHGGGRRRFDDLARLTEAAADLLPDWYDDWVMIERERFRQLRLSALECLCVELTAEGCYPQAAEAGVSAIAADPLRESAHRALISAHLAAGNSGEALRQYRLCRSLLAQRLGTEPSLEMRTLERALPRSRRRGRAAGMGRPLRTRKP